MSLVLGLFTEKLSYNILCQLILKGRSLCLITIQLPWLVATAVEGKGWDTDTGQACVWQTMASAPPSSSFTSSRIANKSLATKWLREFRQQIIIMLFIALSVLLFCETGLNKTRILHPRILHEIGIGWTLCHLLKSNLIFSYVLFQASCGMSAHWIRQTRRNFVRIKWIKIKIKIRSVQGNSKRQTTAILLHLFP